MNNDLVLGDEHPIFSQEEGDQTTPPSEDNQNSQTSQEQVQESTEDESQYYIRLDKRKLDDELAAIVSQDPEFRNIFNRAVGNNAARKYQPRIRELQGHVETYQKLLRREQLSKLSQEEVSKKFEEDPEFARTYADITHFDAPEPRIIPERDEIANNVVGGINNIITFGMRAGLTQDDLRELDANIKGGKYDTDSNGNPLPPESWEEMLSRLQDDVTEKVIQRRNGGNGGATTTAPPPENTNNTQETPPPANNPPPPTRQVDSAQPDLSAAGSRGVHREQITMREFRALPWEEQFRMFPNEGDIEKAVQEGRIIVEGLES